MWHSNFPKYIVCKQKVAGLHFLEEPSEHQEQLVAHRFTLMRPWVISHHRVPGPHLWTKSNIIRGIETPISWVGLSWFPSPIFFPMHLSKYSRVSSSLCFLFNVFENNSGSIVSSLASCRLTFFTLHCDFGLFWCPCFLCMKCQPFHWNNHLDTTLCSHQLL